MNWVAVIGIVEITLKWFKRHLLMRMQKLDQKDTIDEITNILPLPHQTLYSDEAAVVKYW